MQNKEGAKESAAPSLANNGYREKRSLQNRLKKLEQLIDKYQQRATEVESMLADPSFYEEAAQGKLKELLNENGSVQQQLHLAEEEWLGVMSSIDAIETERD